MEKVNNATVKAKAPPSNGAARPDDFNPFENTDVQVRTDGTEIILPAHPAPMTLAQAQAILARKEEEAEAEVRVTGIVDCFPWDGAIAFAKAMREIYGWTQAVPTPGFFGPNPPRFIDVRVGPGPKDIVKTVWGRFVLPNIEGAVSCGVEDHENRDVFAINALVRRKHHQEVNALIERTREIAAAQSIYRGKAFRLPLSNGSINTDLQPEFIDVSKINVAELIFSRTVADQINTNIFAPIERTDLCRQCGIPLKRGILLEGPYGVGKTLTAQHTAARCEKNGWTFIMIQSVSGLSTALNFARLYAPAVVFAEDVDQVMSGPRDEDTNNVLNTLDGVVSKNAEIMTILTTNSVHTIEPALLRPGRLDAVISVVPPDAEAAERLMRVYSRGLIPDGASLSRSRDILDGQIPAMIREAVERAKLVAILRTGAADFHLTDDDIAIAADGMRAQRALLDRPKDGPLSPEEAAGKALLALIKSAISTDALEQAEQRFHESAEAMDIQVSRLKRYLAGNT